MADNNIQSNLNSKISTELTKTYIGTLKTNDEELSLLIKKQIDNVGNLIFILENLGHLPVAFKADCLINLLYHPNEEVRFWTVKNLGKIKSDSYTEILYQKATQDESTMAQ